MTPTDVLATRLRTIASYSGIPLGDSNRRAMREAADRLVHLDSATPIVRSNEKADEALCAFSEKWELLRPIAERWGRGSACQMAAIARNLRKRGLVEQRWIGNMSISEWRLAPGGGK